MSPTPGLGKRPRPRKDVYGARSVFRVRFGNRPRPQVGSWDSHHGGGSIWITGTAPTTGLACQCLDTADTLPNDYASLERFINLLLHATSVTAYELVSQHEREWSKYWIESTRWSGSMPLSCKMYSWETASIEFPDRTGTAKFSLVRKVVAGCVHRRMSRSRFILARQRVGLALEHRAPDRDVL
jgi:hypothetical protein